MIQPPTGHSGHQNKGPSSTVAISRGTTPGTETFMSRQQRDQQVRSRLFALRNETRSTEQLEADSQSAFDILYGANRFTLPNVTHEATIEGVTTFDSEGLASAHQDSLIAISEHREVMVNAISVLVTPNRTLNVLQLQQHFFGSAAQGMQVERADILGIEERDSIYVGENPNLFQRAYNVREGKLIGTSSTKQQIAESESAGKFACTLPETIAAAFATVISGQGPAVGETMTWLAPGSAYRGYDESTTPSFVLKQVTEGVYSASIEPVAIKAKPIQNTRVFWCSSRDFGHGANN